MQKFNDVFRKYIGEKNIDQVLLDSEVSSLVIATEDNAVHVTVSPAGLIPYAVISESQRILARGLSVRSVSITARYLPEMMNEDAFPLLIDYLKGANEPVNGFFIRSEVSFAENRFAVRLPEQIACFLEPLSLTARR